MPRQKLPKAYSTRITPRKTPAVVFEKILKWLTKDVPEENWVRTQTTMSYYKPDNCRSVILATIDFRIEVIIKDQSRESYLFNGFVLSLDEFKLIWDRIL